MSRFRSASTLLSILAFLAILSIPLSRAGAEEGSTDPAPVGRETAAPPSDTGAAEVSAEDAAGTVATEGENVTRADLDALRDLLDEQIRRGVASRYTVNLSGFGILGYYGFRNSPDTFGLNAAGITLSGNLREDPLDEGDLKYRVSLLFPGNAATALSKASASSTSTFDPADNTVTTSTTVSTGKTFVSQPLLTDVFLTWDLLTPKRKLEPTFTLSATFGQQLVPFGQDNFATEDKQPTVKKALYLSRLGIGRDIGLKAEGGIVNRHDPASGVTTPLVAYTLALFNGSGANRNDDNRDKDFVGKLVVTPAKEYFSFFRGLRFGGSFYAGRAGAAGSVKTIRERVGAEFEWLRKPFLVTGEYVVGRDERKKSRGYVGTLFWTPGTLPDFQPLVRYDRFDPDTSRGGDAVRVITAGFNYFFYQVEPVTRRTYEVLKTERVIKAQFNYNAIRQEAAPRTNDEYIAQVVYSF